MEFILSNLIATLQTTTHHLKTTAAPILKSTLHDPDSLPNPEIWDLTLTALDALSNLRLLLEPGHLILADHFLGYTDTKCLVAAVDLRIPDALSSGPKTLPELASHVGANPLRLRQILLTLVNNGIFEYDREKYEYENNRVSILLLEGHWTQWKSWVNVYGNEFYDMARGIPEAVKEGVARTPAQINYDTDDSMFKYFADRNWLGKVQEAMSGGAIAQATGILQDYPWEEIVDMAILDVGGGVGGLVASLLRRFETMTGGILDRKDVIDVAKLNFHTEGGQYADVGGRVPGTSLVAGDFFEHVPKSEVYVMKWCLHNWNDEKASVILKNIRRSIQKGPKSRLIILESVLKDGHVGRISRYADLNMFVAIGGKEREAEEWEKLATETGWNLSRIYPLRNAWPSAIEFIPN
ncbi:S-adenosyl-L-methionine-dependent methyltransferase, partial [Amniculicola lignicola CBS 123094]